MNAKTAWILQGLLFAGLVLGVALTARGWVAAAEARLEGSAQEAEARPAPVVAAKSELGYCSDELKTVLRRVLTNCGLIGGGRRGCQPGELRNVAQISDADFNALFHPLADRGGVLLFDAGASELDAPSRELLERLWADQRGASYFFVAARASTDDSTERNRILSHKRANSVLFALQERFKDPDLEKKLGLLWMGEEFAQLGRDYCGWTLSRDLPGCAEAPSPQKDRTLAKDLNRSVVVSWIDCRL
ncbi:MAG TPA: hypothetical protein PK313_01500 [Myxococcota bacterium]|jgi:hypothetical protein|nr:hypothetical protein [Myxococcota bacterium]